MWNQTVDVAKSILFVTKAVVGWDLLHSGVARLRHKDLADSEVLAVLLQIIVFGIVVHTVDVERAAVRDNGLVGADFIAGQVVITDEGQTGLLHFTGERNASAAEEDGE